MIELFVFEDLTAKDTAERVNEELPGEDTEMKIDNVSQIVKRFRQRVARAARGSRDRGV